MNADPDFAKLSFAEQAQTRSAFVQDMLANDPEAAALDDSSKKQVADALVFAPPATQDPAYQKEMRDLLARADAGDDKAKSQYAGVYQALDLSLNGGLLTAVAFKGTAMISKALNIQPAGGPTLYDAAGTDDAEKMFQYMNARREVGLSDYIDFKAPELSGIAAFREGEMFGNPETVRQVLRFASGAADYVPLNSAFAAVGDAVRATKPVAALINATRSARVIGDVVLPLLAESGAAGATGVGLGKLTEVINNNMSADPETDMRAMGINFGIGAASNFLLGMVFRAPLIHMIAGGKATYGTADLAALGIDTKIQPKSEIDKMIAESATTKGVDPAVLEPLSDFNNARNAYRDSIARLSTVKRSELTPLEALQQDVWQTTHDLVIVPNKTSGIDIIYPKQVGNEIHIVGGTARTVLDAYDIAAQHVTEQTVINPKTGRPENGAIEFFGQDLLNWHSNRVAAGVAAEVAQNSAGVAKRVKIGDRPLISADELAKLSPETGVTPIAVDAHFDGEMLQRLAEHEQIVTYDDLQAFSPSGATAPNAVILAKNIQKIDSAIMDEPGVEKLIALRLKGIDTLQLINKADGATVGFVPLVRDNLKVIVPAVSTEGLLLKGAGKAIAARPLAPGAMIASMTRTVDEVVPASILRDNDQLVVQHVMSMTAGDKIDTQAVSTYAKLLTGNATVKTAIVYGEGKLPSVTYHDGQLDITIPNSKLVGVERTNFAKALTAQLRDSGAMTGLKTAPQRIATQLQAAQNQGPDVIEKLFAVDKTKGVWSSKMLGDVLQGELQAPLTQLPNGSYSTTLGGTTVTGTLTDIWKASKPFLADPKGVRDALAVQGVNLRLRNGKLHATTADAIEYEFTSYADAAEQFGIDSALLPNKYRPSFIEIAPNSNDITVYAEQQTVRLGKQDALRLIDSFTSDKPIEKVTLAKLSEGFASYVKQGDAAIAFIDPRSKTALRFANLAEAQAWVKSNYNTLLGTRELAASKGANVEYENGAYTVALGDSTSTKFRATTLEQVNKKLATLPTTNFNGKEMIAELDGTIQQLPAGLLARWQSFKREMQPLRNDTLDAYADWRPEYTATNAQHVSNYLETFGSSLERLRRDGKLHPVLVAPIEAVKAGVSGRRVNTLQADRMLDAIFRVTKKGELTVGAKGYVLSAEARQTIFYHMNAQTDTELSNIRPLTATEETVMTQLREVYRVHATKFGLDPNMLNGNYATRIRSAVKANPQLLARVQAADTAGDALRLIRVARSDLDRPVTEMLNWFEHQRSNEMLDTIFDTDIYSATRKYLHAGLRKYWMEVPLQELQAAYNSVRFTKLPSGEVIESGKMPEDTNQLLTRFILQANGGAESALGQTLKNVGENTFRFFGKHMADIAERIPNRNLLEASELFRSPEFALKGQRLMDDITTIGYATWLGAKAGLAARNVVQIYTMYGPALGYRTLDDAVTTWTRMSRMEKFNYLRGLEKLDVVSSAHPYANAIGGSSNIQRGAAWLMQWFAHGDEYTRLLGYSAATAKFIRATQALSDGKFGTGEVAKLTFIDNCGLGLFEKTEPEFVTKVWDAVSANVKDAKSMNLAKLNIPSEQLKLVNDQFAKKVVDLVQFNYSSWNKPMAFSSGVSGRLLGQLGSFSAGYRSYLYHLQRNVNPDEFMVHMVSMIAANVAAWSAFELAGIKTQDFVPFAPALPGVGPLIGALATGVNAAQPGITGSMARNQLLREFAPLAPGKKEKLPGIPAALIETPWVANYPTMLLGSAQYNSMVKAYTYASRGDYWKAIASLTASRIEDDEQSDLSLGPQGLQLTLPGLHPQAVARSLANLLSRTRQ